MPRLSPGHEHQVGTKFSEYPESGCFSAFVLPGAAGSDEQQAAARLLAESVASYVSLVRC